MLCFAQSFLEEFGETLNPKYNFGYEKQDGNERGMTFTLTIPTDSRGMLEDVVQKSNIGQGATKVTVNQKPQNGDTKVTINVCHDVKTLELARDQRKKIRAREKVGR